jgi:vanillate O-demethylase ferredoxin subunit
MAATRPFEVRLARTDRRLAVPANRSLLDVLLEAGIRVPHLCCHGSCGTCQTRVLDGVPEHRDMLLPGSHAQAVDRMMPCVSRSMTPVLTLDL